MPQSFRQTEILDIAKREGRVVVEDLARRFDVTLQTIRRDLTELADAGYLNRVHGGAMPSAGVTNLGYDHRRRMNSAAKARIGRVKRPKTSTFSPRSVSSSMVRTAARIAG